MIMNTLCLCVFFTDFTFAAAFSNLCCYAVHHRERWCAYIAASYRHRGRIWQLLLMFQVNLVSWRHKSSHNKAKDSQRIKWILKSWCRKYSTVKWFQKSDSWIMFLCIKYLKCSNKQKSSRNTINMSPEVNSFLMIKKRCMYVISHHLIIVLPCFHTTVILLFYSNFPNKLNLNLQLNYRFPVLCSVFVSYGRFTEISSAAKMLLFCLIFHYTD